MTVNMGGNAAQERSLLGNPREQDHLEDLGINGSVISDHQEVGDGPMKWTDLAEDIRTGRCKSGCEHLGSTKCREFLD